MSSNYCPRIHHGLTLNKIHQQGLSYSACCWAPNSIKDELNFNHPILLDLRNQNKNNTLPDYYCRRCLDQEHAGQQSMRQGYIKQHGSPTYNAEVQYLDINIDYSCNLACVTCGPEYSTTWRNELKLKSIEIRPNIDNFISTQLEKVDLGALKEIRLWGGEPFLTHTHTRILEYVVANTDASNIRLMYNTNGTQKINSATKELLEKFKFVRVSFSIDEINSRYEYLRWPATWTETQQTLLWWRENLPHNSMLSLTVTASILNVLSLNNVFNWHRKNFSHSKFGDDIEIYVHQAFGLYGLDAMPSAMIEHLQSIENYCQPWIQKLEILGKDQSRLPLIIQTLKELNQRRNLDFFSVMPEVAKFIGY